MTRIESDSEAVIEMLVLAITADTAEKREGAMQLAGCLAAHLTPEEVENCQQKASQAIARQVAEAINRDAAEIIAKEAADA